MTARHPSLPPRRHPASSPWASAVVLLAFALVAGLPAVVDAAAPPAPKVYRDRVQPHWFNENREFWYRLDLAGEAREFIRVNTTNGTRLPAFDHARVAVALGTLIQTNVDARRLPLQSLRFAADGASVTLTGETESWRLDLASYQITADPSADQADDSLPVLAEPRASTQTGPETSILFDNRLTEDVALFWLDDAGQRQAYGSLKPRETRRQHTFAGHFWLAFRKGEFVAAYQAARQPRRAIIDGRPVTTRDADRRSGPSSRRPAEAATVRSPDGSREVFVRDHNLWVRTFNPASERPLSFDGNPGDSFHKDVQRARFVGMEYDAPEPPATLPEVFWAPDSRWVLALQTRAVPERHVQLVESSPRDQLQPRLSSYPYFKAGDDIPTQRPRLFHTDTGREAAIARDAFPNPWSLDEFRWAPDGSRVTFLYNQRGHQVMRVLAVTPPDLASPAPTRASVTTLVDESCVTFFDYSNKTYLEFLDASGEFLWMSERSGWNHLYLCDARTGQPKNPVTQGEWVVHRVDKIDAAARQVWFYAGGIRPGQDPYHLHLARVNFDGTGLTILTEGDGTHEIQWAPDRRCFLDTWSRVDLPPVTELRRATDGSRICDLEQADAGEVLAARGAFPSRFVAMGRDGTTDIHGIIHRPHPFDASRKYPVIENIYAGPHGQHVPKAFRAAYRTQDELTARGFIVVQIDGMGTNWRSKKFHDVAWKNIGDAGFPDRIAWMRAAAAALPGFDLSRVGIYGGSAGGQNALRALLAHGDFYRAGAADCGCHDNRMDKIWWSEAWMGWPVGPHYAEQSNVTQATNLTGKLMLFVGELDRNVDPASTLQVVNALEKANKDFDLVLMTGSGHGSAESDYGRRRRADFFVRHLQGPTAP